MTIEKILSILDQCDAVKFQEIITDNAVFVNGNMPAVEGREAILKSQTAFFAAIKAMKHTVKRTWEGENTLVAEMVVTYTRLDGSVVSLPVTDVYTIENGKLSGVYVYMDVNPLFAPVAVE